MKLEQTFRQLARHIDDIWPDLTDKEKAEHKKNMRVLRLYSPEFRKMWRKEANKAALKRRYTNDS